MVTTASLTFGMQLRRHRLATGLTQEALAERAGLSARGVQDLERGIRQAPRPETVRMLADALELDAAVRADFIAAAHPELAAPATTVPGHLRRPALPVPLTVLVGRELEVAEICLQLRRPQVRLLTLTGPGGSGKTRLALAAATELAEEFADGVVWVDLAPVGDAGLVTGVVARALGVREAGDRPLAKLLQQTVAERHLLLVLDTCEHVLPAMPLVADLLAASPHLVVLATSRSRLRLRGEQEFPVPPLAAPVATATAPSPLAGTAGVPAVRLFVERAQEVAPGFTLTDDNAPAVAAICRQVDGLPLALELAAARVKLLPPATLLARLAQRLPLLTEGARDAPLRQRTMRNAIAWSHDLLTPEEQTLFRRVAVFAGGCSLEAVVAVTTADSGLHLQGDILEGLAALLDQSLLRLGEGLAPGGTGEPRFTLLETIREYALDRLAASGEEEAVRRAPAAYMLSLAEAARARILGADVAIVLNRLEAEHDNLRAALAWAIARHEVRLALRITNAAWRLWWMHSHLDQGRLWLERVLALPDPDRTAVDLRPRALVAAGYFDRVRGAYAQAIAKGEEALATARVTDDREAMAAALYLLGLAAFDQGDLEQARAHHQASLALERERGDRHGEAHSLMCLGEIALAQGNLAESRSLGEEALAIWHDRAFAWGMAGALVQLGKVARAEGDVARAVELYCRSLDTNAQLGDKAIMARAISELAALAADRHQFALAVQLFGSVAALREAIGAPMAPTERSGHEHAVATARAGLNEAVFAAAWEAGRSQPLERIIAEAQRLADV